MEEKPLGVLTLLALLGAASDTTFTTDLTALVSGALAVIILERYYLRLDKNLAFNPAAGLYLGLAIAPGFGSLTSAVLLSIHILARSKTPLSESSSQALGIAVALAVSAACHLWVPGTAWLPYIVVPLTYLLMSWLQGKAIRQPANEKQKNLWYALHLRIKPLELAQGIGAVATALLLTHYPWSPLLVCPIFGVGRLAAENIRNRVYQRKVEELNDALRDVSKTKQKTEQKLSAAQRNVQLLEGFSRHLLGKPNLTETAGALLETAGQVVDCDTVALFLGSPPEPYLCRGSQQHRDRLQGATLTGLREPIVDQSRSAGKPVHSRNLGPSAERLFQQDHLGAAVPVGRFGVLYLGRGTSEPFNKGELAQISRFSQKAELALNSAYAEQEAQTEKRRLHRTLENLEGRLSWMSLLLKSSESLSSTLEPSSLQAKFVEILMATIPHQAGLCAVDGLATQTWGQPFSLPPVLRQKVQQSPSLLLPRLSELSEADMDGFESLLSGHLADRQRRLGTVVLLSSSEEAFSREQIEFLGLLNSQLTMALHNSQLFSDVVEARKRLQESQAQLVQSSKMTAMGQLAAGVAHELNTPLGAISLTLEDIQGLVRGNDDLSSGITLAMDAVEKARKIIERLMSYSRKPTGEHLDVNLKEMITETVEFVRSQLRALKTTARLELADDCNVVGEWQALSQAFLNLLLNGAQAMQALPDSERVIKVSLERTERSAILRVVDGGEGIEPDLMDQVFDPFFTTKPIGKGTGLGLWASLRIVNEHGGQLKLESLPGQGTTATIELPIKG